MRDFYTEFLEHRKKLLEGVDADLAAAPPPLAAEPATAETDVPGRVTGEISVNGRGINSYLADLLEQT